MSGPSYKKLLQQVLPYALIGAGEDPEALFLVQTADAAISAAYENLKQRMKERYAADPERFKQKTKEYKRIHGDPTAAQRKARYNARLAYRRERNKEYVQRRKDSGKLAEYVEKTTDGRISRRHR
jgi:hypothetical protein